MVGNGLKKKDSEKNETRTNSFKYIVKIKKDVDTAHGYATIIGEKLGRQDTQKNLIKSVRNNTKLMTKYDSERNSV